MSVEEPPRLLALGVAMEGFGDALDSGKPLTKRLVMRRIAQAAARYIDAEGDRLSAEERAELSALRALAKRLTASTRHS